MGRNAKPIQLHAIEGNPNRLTKAEIERRKKSEVKVQNKNFKPSELVKADDRAHKEFKKLKKLYKEIEFVGSLDEHIINEYCLSVAELDDLVKAMNVARTDMKSEDRETKEKGLSMFLTLGTEIRMKRQEIVRLSDRLYLNPVARTKNVPKQSKDNDKPKNKFSKFVGGDSG